MPAPDTATMHLWKEACTVVADVLSFDRTPKGRAEFARSGTRLQSAIARRMVEADVSWTANTLTKDYHGHAWGAFRRL